MDSVVPSYVAIARDLCALIESGKIPVGQRIPSYSALAARYDVSVGTVQDAVKLLRHDGYVVTVPGRTRGTYVASRTPAGPRDATVSAFRQMGPQFDSMRAELERTRDRLDALDAQWTDPPEPTQT